MECCQCGCEGCKRVCDSLSQVEAERDIAQAMVTVLQAEVDNLREDLALLRTGRANESL